MNQVKRAKTSARGMTLVEVMIVVAMIGVMAAIALVSYMRYVDWAQIATTKDIIHGITAGEEAYYADAEGYLGCSTGWNDGDLYPLEKAPDSRKAHFHDPTHPLYQCFRMMNVVVPEPTYMRFWVDGGVANTGWPGMPAGFNHGPIPLAMQTPGKPWYMVVGVGDQDEDGERSFFMTHSGAPQQIFTQGESE